MQLVARIQIFVDVLIDLLGWNTASLTALRENKTKSNTKADFHSCTLTAKM